MQTDNNRRKQRNVKKRRTDTAKRRAIKLRRKRKRKLYLMVFAFFVCFIYLAYVIIDQKFFYGEEYEARAITQLINGSTKSEQTLYPNRGSILDRNMTNIAVSTKVYNIYIDPRLLVNDDRNIPQKQINPETGKEEYIKQINPETEKEEVVYLSVMEDTVKKITRILGIPTEEIVQHLQIVETKLDENGKKIYTPSSDNNYQIIAREIPGDKALELERSGANHIQYVAESKRHYVHGSFASSVIGFIRGDTIMGLEKQYDRYLKGTEGRSFKVYSSDGDIQTDRIEAKDGDTLVTTIDANMQKFSEEIARKYGEEFDAERTSVIIMNPDTAEIFSMAAYPSFDLNDPVNTESVTKSRYREEWRNLEEKEKFEKLDSIWRNYNITSTFEPGSIFKPVTVGAALEEGIISKTSTYYCPGTKEVADYEIDCHKTTGHGNLTLSGSITHSCNVAMMEIAEKMGRDIFYKYQKDFGFGEKTGIDLPAEIPASSLLHSLSNLNSTELATGSFGQRFNATPLQDITAFSALINGGNLMRPYIVSQIIDADGNLVKENTPTIVRKVISPETSDYLRVEMEKVITEGTGKKALIKGWNVGGKTGTGEQGIRDTAGYHHNLAFIGYFPVDDPQYVIMVAIDDFPNYVDGESSPAPMFKEVVENIIKYKNIPPSYDAEDTADLYDDSSTVIVGDYTNMPLDQATRDLNRLSLDYELIGGSGTVVKSQFPTAGTKAPKDTIVLLTITSGDTNYELATVPNITGLTQLEAEEILKTLNLVPSAKFEEGEEPIIETPESQEQPDAPEQPETPAEQSQPYDKELYTVTTQMPEADKKVMIGTEVKIKLKRINAE